MSELDAGLDRLLLPREPKARLARIEAIVWQRNEMEAALRRIVACDYRGNEPMEQRIARETLDRFRG